MKNMKLLLASALFGCALGFDESYWTNTARTYRLSDDAHVNALYDRIAASDGEEGISIADAGDFIEYLLSVQQITDLAEQAVREVIGDPTFEIDWDHAVSTGHWYLENVLFPYYGTDLFPPPENDTFTWDRDAFKDFIHYYIGIWINHGQDIGTDFQDLHFAGTAEGPSTDGEPQWLGALVTALDGGHSLDTYNHQYWASSARTYRLSEEADVESLYHRIADADGEDELSLTDVKHFVTYLLSVDEIIGLANQAVSHVLGYDYEIDVASALSVGYGFIHDVAWPYYALGYIPLDDTPYEHLTFDLDQFSRFIGYYIGLWIDHGQDAIGVEFQNLHFQAETDKGPPRDGEPEWLGALLTFGGDAGEADCDSSCSCNFVGTGTNLNVQFLCQADNVCYNLVSGWCAEDETACEIPN